ncbi:putative ABC transporter permease [Eubacteriales bacterium OttesenSCG-928-A19]|nr:putative ABC transporter permease [Eubacteriales bacterium OttesenSCG-928-A19]
MENSLYEGVLLFTIFSVMGWICESIWCSIGEGKVVNRGFLSGPYCPIYGFGGLLILAICLPLQAWPPLVFVMALVSASILEYFTGWLLETLFHTRWWDYSKRFLNIKGRVCLRNSVLFGLMGIAVTYFVYPPLSRLLGDIPLAVQRGLSIGIALVFAADLTHTVVVLTGLQKRLRGLHEAIHELERYNEAYSWFDLKDLDGSIERLRAICEADSGNGTAAAILERLDALTKRNVTSARLLRAFPGSTHKDLPEELNALRDAWRKRIAARRDKDAGAE